MKIKWGFYTVWVEGTHVATEGKISFNKRISSMFHHASLTSWWKKELHVNRGKLYHMRFSITWSHFKPVPILKSSKLWLIIWLSYCQHDIGSKTETDNHREYRYYLINWPSWQNNRVILPRRENLPVKTEPSILKHTPALDASAFQLASHGAIVMRSTEHRKHAHNKPVLSGPCNWQRDKRNVCMRTQISEH